LKLRTQSARGCTFELPPVVVDSGYDITLKLRLDRIDEDTQNFRLVTYSFDGELQRRCISTARVGVPKAQGSVRVSNPAPQYDRRRHRIARALADAAKVLQDALDEAKKGGGVNLQAIGAKVRARVEMEIQQLNDLHEAAQRGFQQWPEKSRRLAEDLRLKLTHVLDTALRTMNEPGERLRAWIERARNKLLSLAAAVLRQTSSFVDMSFAPRMLRVILERVLIANRDYDFQELVRHWNGGQWTNYVTPGDQRARPDDLDPVEDIPEGEGGAFYDDQCPCFLL